MCKIIFLLQTYCYAVLYCILPLLSPVTYNPPSNRYIYLSTKMRPINPPPPPGCGPLDSSFYDVLKLD